MFFVPERGVVRAIIGNNYDHSTMPDVRSLAVAYLGSYALMTFISGIELGVIITCFGRFLARSEKERMHIKLLVYLVTAFAVLQTGATFAAWWKISVQDFDNWSAAAIPAWPQKINSLLTTFIAAPVQLFLIWRCWNLLKRWRWLFAIPLVLLVIGTIITSIYVTAIIFLLQYQSKNTKTLSLHTFFTCFALSQAFSAVVDIAVTSILLVFLIRSRYEVSTRQFRKVLSQLITITWEAAVPPCACAIAALIACIVGAPFVSYWSGMLQVVLGKLYLISLFVTLEGREKLTVVHDLTHFPTLTNMTQREESPSVQAEQVDLRKQPDMPMTFVVVSNGTTTEECSNDLDSSRV